MSKSKVKWMLVIPCVLFTKSGFLLDRQAVNITKQKFLEKLRKRVMRIRPNIAENWILHRDNASAPAALSIAQFLTSKCITAMPQSP